MVHSFHYREESMQNKYGLFVYFACGFCFPCQAAAVVDYIGPAVGLSYLPCLMSNSESKQKDIATLCKKGKKLCRNWCRNHEHMIVDAERHRRTPGTPATWSKEMGSEKSAGFRDIGGKKCTKSEPKGTKREPTGSQRAQNGDQNPSKIDEKSRLCRGCVFGSFFGSVFGAGADLDWPSSATIFDQKSQKRHQKRHAKIDVEKVSKNNAKSDQKWCQNGYQHR